VSTRRTMIWPGALRWPALALALTASLLLLLSVDQSSGYDWQNGPGYRRARLDPIGAGKDGFTLLSPSQTGILFTNMLSEQRTLASEILPNGSGVAAGDVDGDGLCDLYFCGLKCGNRLFRNLGNWKFEDITDKAGVSCKDLDATGVALADMDGDGTLDLVLNSVGGGTHIFFNDGKGHFTESREVLNLQRGGMSLAIADYDGDGWLDVYVANYRFHTIGDTDARFNVRPVDGKLVVASINNQPLTDPEWTNRFVFQIKDAGDGKVKFTKEELGEPDALFRNLGHGRFTQVPWTEGAFLDEDGKTLAHAPFDWGLSAMFHDLNNDGKPDLYVCNDFNTPDRIWINQGQGRFRAIDRLAIRQLPFSSMGVDVADINANGFDDIFACEMLSRDHRRRLTQRPNLKPEIFQPGLIDNRPQYPRNSLFVSRGDGTFAELAQYAGLEASEWSWTPIFLDVDLDGYPDLLIANGFARDSMNVDALDAMQRANRGKPVSAEVTAQSRRLLPPLATPNCAFHNLGGLKFAEVGHQWGFDTPAISQGMCLADLDNDGDMDVIVNNFNSVAGIYRNDTAKPRLAVMLKGSGHNTRGIGARIRVFGGPAPIQSQEMICGGRYLSSDQPMRVFAAGTLTNVLRIEVDWPGGKRSIVKDASPNYIYEIDEARAEPAVSAPVKPVQPFFEDVSGRLNHVHHEEAFDDFARQPGLPRRLSQGGPGVCWTDVDGDGWDDLVIGSGKGAAMAVFLNNGKGGFEPSTNVSSAPATRDHTAILAVPESSGHPSILAGLANYEDGSSADASALRYDPASGNVQSAVPGVAESTGPLALGDLDGDGNLDLFVGGRVLPGKYPVAANSRIFRGHNGKFELDQPNSKVLEKVGLVSGALWSDLDGDGFPELILACEWGPIRIFHNDHGHLYESNFPVTGLPSSTLNSQPPVLRSAFDEGGSTLNSQPSTLNQFKGWWNGVTTGDLDGDGRLDIIASNWGQNTKYQSHRAAPLRLYYGDFNGDQGVALLEAYFEPAMGAYVPERRLDAAAESMPFLRGKFNSHDAFARATVESILEDHKSEAHYLEANWLESTVFLNRGDKLEPRLLPPEAQFAPAFAVVAADYDGDGHEDVFLSQNFFAETPETSRCDAGRSLWLRGDGHGNLTAVPGQESGVTVYGEQRGAAVADFDGDGRIDLVVTQNGAATRLFRNVRAKPGLRVRLKGPPGNPFGYGAQLRLKHGDHFGPVSEIHGGGGYWSQDSPVQVLAGVDSGSQIWVRWPGGKTLTVDVPADSAEIQVGMDGEVTRVR
jgi:enediyne biosynthesis protein E4